MSQPRATLEGVPPELRLRIYSHLTDLHRAEPKTINLPALLDVNRKIYHEALPILYASLEHKVKRFEAPSHALPHVRRVFIYLDASLFSNTVGKLSALISYLIRWCAKLERVRIYVDTTSSEVGWSVSKPDIDKLRFDVPPAVARALTLREIVVETREWRLRSELQVCNETDWLREIVEWGLRQAAGKVGLSVDIWSKRCLFQMRVVLPEDDNEDESDEGVSDAVDPGPPAFRPIPHKSQHWGGHGGISTSLARKIDSVPGSRDKSDSGPWRSGAHLEGTKAAGGWLGESQ